MFESKTIGDGAFAASASTGLSSVGGLPNLQIPSTFNATQEFAALWHFFYKFMESLTHLRWFEDELWRRLDVCSHADPGSMRALIDMMATCSTRDRVDARNLFLVWKLCSLPTRVAFSRYAEAWLRGLRTSSLPEHLPGGQFQAPPEVAGSFEAAALAAGLIYGAVAHVDAPEVGAVWVRASHWMNLAVADDAESGHAFRLFCWASTQLNATHWAARRYEVSRIGVKAMGVSPDWVRRYRHAEVKIHWGTLMYRAREEVGLSVHQFSVAREELQR